MTNISNDETTTSTNQTVSGMDEQGVVSESAVVDLMVGIDCRMMPVSEGNGILSEWLSYRTMRLGNAERRQNSLSHICRNLQGKMSSFSGKMDSSFEIKRGSRGAN